MMITNAGTWKRLHVETFGPSKMPEQHFLRSKRFHGVNVGTWKRLHVETFCIYISRRKHPDSSLAGAFTGRGNVSDPQKTFPRGRIPKRFHVDAPQNVSTWAHRGRTRKTFPVSTWAHRGTWKRFYLGKIFPMRHRGNVVDRSNVLEIAGTWKRFGSSQTFPRGMVLLGVTAA